MADFVYTKACTKIATGTINFSTADLRIILCMTNTTAGTQEDTEFISGFTTLDEMDGANYARATLTSEAVNEDTTNNRAEFDFDNPVFTSLGAGTRSVAGFILYVHVTNDTDSYPVVWVDTNFPFTANGGNLTLNINVEGFLQFATG